MIGDKKNADDFISINTVIILAEKIIIIYYKD